MTTATDHATDPLVIVPTDADEDRAREWYRHHMCGASFVDVVALAIACERERFRALAVKRCHDTRTAWFTSADARAAASECAQAVRMLEEAT